MKREEIEKNEKISQGLKLKFLQKLKNLTLVRRKLFLSRLHSIAFTLNLDIFIILGYHFIYKVKQELSLIIIYIAKLFEI